MKSDSVGSFFAALRWKFFKSRVDREICDRIGAQLRHEGNFGYPFTTRSEMNTQTDAMEASKLLADIERQVARMPEFYGEAFRHIMHRDLHERLQLYQQLAAKRIQPSESAARYVATRA